MMIDSIKINATLPTFQGNFEEVKIKLSEGLKLYEIGVTADNLKDANAMATELNKLRCHTSGCLLKSSFSK